MGKSSSIRWPGHGHGYVAMEGGFGGVRGLPGAVVSTCIVNEISWCANPAWVNYANVLHAYIYLCPPVGRVCILYPGPGHSAMAAAERK